MNKPVNGSIACLRQISTETFETGQTLILCSSENLKQVIGNERFIRNWFVLSSELRKPQLGYQDG
jgi:hypothetical protein